MNKRIISLSMAAVLVLGIAASIAWRGNGGSSGGGGASTVTTDGTTVTGDGSVGSPIAIKTPVANASTYNGATTSVTVTLATGAFTCSFANASICIVTESDNTSPLVPTLTNLPTNQFITFVFIQNSHTAIAVNWPTNVKCPGGTGPTTSVDVWGNCGSSNWLAGNANGYGNGSATTFWSDGTNIWITPATQIRAQTVLASHGNFNAAQIGTANAAGAGTQTNLYLYGGAVIKSNNAGGTTTAPTVTGADGTHCGSGAAFVTSSFPDTLAFSITMGSTNPTTVCPVTFGVSAPCSSLGGTCVATDASTFQVIKCAVDSTGAFLTLTAATDMHGDTINVITICR